MLNVATVLFATIEVVEAFGKKKKESEPEPEPLPEPVADGNLEKFFNIVVLVVSVVMTLWLLFDRNKTFPKYVPPEKKPQWMKDVVALEAKGSIYTAAEPGEYNAAKHVPVITTPAKSGGVAKIVVPHSMEDDHWIQYIWAKDAAGAIVAGKKLAPSDKPELTFTTPTGDEHRCILSNTVASTEPWSDLTNDCLSSSLIDTDQIVAYEACNKHGVWMAESPRF